MVISNKYKDTLDDFIDSSDTKSPDWPDSPDRPELIDKGLCNASRSRGHSLTLLEEDCLDEDVLVTSLELMSKIRVSQVHQCYDIASLDSKSRRAQYGNSQRGREDGKGKRGRENGKGKRGH